VVKLRTISKPAEEQYIVQKTDEHVRKNKRVKTNCTGFVMPRGLYMVHRSRQVTDRQRRRISKARSKSRKILPARVGCACRSVIVVGPCISIAQSSVMIPFTPPLCVLPPSLALAVCILFPPGPIPEPFVEDVLDRSW